MRRRDREAALAELTAWPPRDVVMLLHQLPLNRARRLFWCLPIARGIGGWTSWTLRLARFRRRRVAGPPGCHPAPGQRRRCSRRGATPARRDGRTPSRATAPGLTVGHPACIQSRYRQRDRDPSLRHRRQGAGRADPRRVPGTLGATVPLGLHRLDVDPGVSTGVSSPPPTTSSASACSVLSPPGSTCSGPPPGSSRSPVRRPAPEPARGRRPGPRRGGRRSWRRRVPSTLRTSLPTRSGRTARRSSPT